MAIKITKKRALPLAEEPEALVDPRRVKTDPQLERNLLSVVHHKDKIIASSMDHLLANRTTMRAPDPTLCSFCKHPYGFPCHGKAKDCMSAAWIRSGKTTAKVD